jgi:hypothetical protein
MASPHSPNQNHLLAALPTAEFERLAADLELVPLPLGEILFEPGGQMQHAYFPTTAIVSLHYVMENGRIGRDGRGGQRRRGRRFALHGWEHHFELCRGEDGGPRVPAEERAPEAGIQPRWPDAAACCCAIPRR